MKKYIICYLVGTGGTMVSQVCDCLLNNKPIMINVNASAVECIKSFQTDLNYVDQSTAFRVECEFINSLTFNNRVSKGHLHNLALLIRNGMHVIYISFTDKDKKLIYTNIHNKQPSIIENRSKHDQYYNIIADKSWPSFEEYINNTYKYTKIHEEITERQTDFVTGWNWILPTDKKMLHEIKIYDLFNNTKWVDRLSDFLQADKASSYLIDEINRYIKMNKNLHE